jgi:hypothetical protein
LEGNRKAKVAPVRCDTAAIKSSGRPGSAKGRNSGLIFASPREHSCEIKAGHAQSVEDSKRLDSFETKGGDDMPVADAKPVCGAVERSILDDQVQILLNFFLRH